VSNQSIAARSNLDLLEAQYDRWRTDPSLVDASWRAFFEGFELGACFDGAVAAPPSASGIIRLIDAYRDFGHFVAHLDPLNDPPNDDGLLKLAEFGLSDADLDRTFDTSHFYGASRSTLRELLQALRETYCRTIGVEYMHILDLEVRRWLQERMEPRRNQPGFTREQRIALLGKLLSADLFEKFLHARYPGQKRFSLEGSETVVPVLDAIVEKAPDLGVSEIVLGMAHRGRLNVLANILHKPHEEIFAEFEDIAEPESVSGDGDVKYHLGFSSDRVTVAGTKIHLSLTPNPSHLEAVNPVVEGRTRAKQWLFQDEERRRGLPLLIHGDAAFSGQGLVAETLNLARLEGYTTGGTIHLVINNQIGFTTAPDEARSTTYCTEVAKIIQAPVFHVNAEDPEAGVYVAELALEFRQHFRQDVVIDLVGYRRHGHSETDDPSFTQPVMYAKIKARPPLAQLYREQLIRDGNLRTDEADVIIQEFRDKLESAQNQARRGDIRRVGSRGYAGRWQDFSPRYSAAPVDTAVPFERLVHVAQTIARFPDGFVPHSKVLRRYETQRDELVQRQPVDWSLAETLAFGSLLSEGTSIRLTGQDTQRGTFSQRHAVVYDVGTGKPHIPLAGLAQSQGRFEVYDSPLSETAALGFEFGYSLDLPHALVAWEAQFGDFANGAQVIIDQFLVCSESKWQRGSGLVLLLPHGYEGQGPEHSSARLERFLQMCAEDNIQVCNPTTPAQYFHLLRRQIKRSFRKPLVVMTPKSLLRHSQAVSPVDAFTSGHFHEVIDDSLQAAGVRRVLICSGKIYYELCDERSKSAGRHVAIVRLEQLYPFPADALEKALGRYHKANEFAWVQEESMNMGAWTFVEPRLRQMRDSIAYVGRDASASPAAGSHQVHQREQRDLVQAALSGTLPHLVGTTALPPIRPKPYGRGDGAIKRSRKAKRR
jgi:2-oxoglutarate dehydrogenase E1 component